MRPRLNPNVRYVPCGDGVYLRGPRGARTLTGEHSYQWVDKLAPYLTGEYLLTELTADLPGPQRDSVENLVTTLLEHGFVADVQADLPHTLTAEERTEYAAEIAFVAAVTDSAEHRFQRYRQSRVLVLGDGPVGAAVVAAGLRSGLANVTETADPAGADVVLQCSSSVDELVDTARFCAEEGITLGQILLDGGTAWITEVGSPLEEAWTRLRANDVLTHEPADKWLTGAVPTIVASHLVLSCFQHATGLDTLPLPEDDRVGPVITRHDLTTLDVTIHDVSPLSVRTWDELLDTARLFVDRYTGVLTHLDEDELQQFPVFLCRATAHGTDVVGWGSDWKAARGRAILTALATRAQVGAAAGVTRDAAVEWGLRQHLEQLLAGHDGPPAELPLDEHGQDLLRQLEVLRQDVRVTDLSGVFGVPAYALRAGDEQLVTCAAEPAIALAHGLERVLVAWQTRTRWQDWPAPPATSIEPGWVRVLTAALDKAGYQPVVLDVENRTFPAVVQVVLDER